MTKDKMPSTFDKEKKEAFELLKDGKLHQTLRKEILYGLIPKTVSGIISYNL